MEEDVHEMMKKMQPGDKKVDTESRAKQTAPKLLRGDPLEGSNIEFMRHGFDTHPDP